MSYIILHETTFIAFSQQNVIFRLGIQTKLDAQSTTTIEGGKSPTSPTILVNSKLSFTFDSDSYLVTKECHHKFLSDYKTTDTSLDVTWVRNGFVAILANKLCSATASIRRNSDS